MKEIEKYCQIIVFVLILAIVFSALTLDVIGRVKDVPPTESIDYLMTPKEIEVGVMIEDKFRHDIIESNRLVSRISQIEAENRKLINKILNANSIIRKDKDTWTWNSKTGKLNLINKGR